MSNKVFNVYQDKFCYVIDAKSYVHNRNAVCGVFFNSRELGSNCVPLLAFQSCVINDLFRYSHDVHINHTNLMNSTNLKLLCTAWTLRVRISIISINSSPPEQNDCHFADDIFTCIFGNENLCFFIKISPKIVPKGPIDNNPTLV